MVPMLLIFVAGYLAMTRLPATASEPVPEIASSESALSWWGRFASRPAYALRSLAAIGAIGVVLLGAAPMVAASTNSVGDPLLTEAINGNPAFTNVAAVPFKLVDQDGSSVSLGDLRGKVVALTFLDPVCTTDCPLIAQEFAEADQMLGALASRAEFVAIVANPIYRSVAATAAFTRTEGLARVKNWLFLTGSLSALKRVWNAYGIAVAVEPAGAMVAHSEIAYLIDQKGRVRVILNSDPGGGTAPMRSSFAGLVAGELRHLLTAS
jgi:cytochrome oxidase Cu insertion factor (SCO1/SenC/PrrC family)